MLAGWLGTLAGWLGTLAGWLGTLAGWLGTLAGWLGLPLCLALHTSRATRHLAHAWTHTMVCATHACLIVCVSARASRAPLSTSPQGIHYACMQSFPCVVADLSVCGGFLLPPQLVEDVSTILGVAGSTGSTSISFILPTLFYCRLDPAPNVSCRKVG